MSIFLDVCIIVSNIYLLSDWYRSIFLLIASIAMTPVETMLVVQYNIITDTLMLYFSGKKRPNYFSP